MAGLTITIRRYRDSDKDAVWQLHQLALEPTGAMLPGGPWSDEDLNRIEEEYINNSGDFLVGVVNNQIVCMGALKKISDSLAEVKRMRVHPDYQRKGFGQLMLRRLEQKARELGYSELCLDTTTQQIPAQKLYEKNGFTETSRGRFRSLELIYYSKRL